MLLVEGWKVDIQLSIRKLIGDLIGELIKSNLKYVSFLADRHTLRYLGNLSNAVTGKVKSTSS